MSSVVITPIAEALVAIIESIDLKGELWEPKTVSPPAGAVGVPVIRRTNPDEAESQLHSDDWFLDFGVSLYFDLAKAQPAQQGMVDAAEAFIAAIDADTSLGIDPLLEAKVTDCQPFVEQDRRRPLCGYEITVSTHRLVQ